MRQNLPPKLITTPAGSGGGGCFIGSTRISIPDGQKPIASIQVGDTVLSFDDKGDVHEAKVLKVHKHENEEIWEYSFWGGSSFTATPNHWVLNQFNAFVGIGTLDTDDCVINQNNHLVPITGKKPIGFATVYNLTVENQHTFIAENIRVHNAGLGLGIRGAGGGGNKGRGGSPTEASDSLQSVQYGRVLDLISEGEIDGIEGGAKGIYLNNTPVLNADGSENFTGYEVATRNGTQTQTYLGDDKAKVEAEVAVNAEVTYNVPIVRTITDRDVDRVRVTMRIPALQRFEDDGDIVGTSVSIDIQIQYNGGGYNSVKAQTINGKSSSVYKRDFMIPLTGAFPVDIKFKRTSADSASSKIANQTWWTSYTKIKDERLQYPNSALCWLKFDSTQFSSIPERKYLVRGIKVKLPSNASVDTTTHLGRVTYTGVWDGTFGAATWCADPAWCLYDLMISTRYGASIAESSLDKWDFYNISQYCNALVNDGKGGQEPRFACHFYLNSRAEIYNVIQQMTSLFRGISYYAAGSLVVLQDKPADPQYLLGPENVIEGNFEYSGTGQKARHTTCSVAWQDYTMLGEVQWEYAENADAIAKYGVINQEFRAIGCYSQGQALRAANWLLLAEQNLTETVSFGVSMESGIIIRPGMVFEVADPVKAGQRRSGRVSSATTTSVVIDSAEDVSVDLSKSPTISVLLPTGLIEKKTITNISGTTVSISGSFSQAPVSPSIWLIETTNLQPQKFRAVAVTEGDAGAYTVTALLYNESIYSAIENNTKIETPAISNLSVAPEAVTNITFKEYMYEDLNNNVLTAVDVSWTPPAQNVSEYLVNYRMGEDNWVQATTLTPSLHIEGLQAGTLQVEVMATNFIGQNSPFANGSTTVAGKTSFPGDVQNLTIEAISENTARLSWDAATEADVKNGGKVHIRHSTITDGSANWGQGTALIESLSGATSSVVIPMLPGEVMVKFADSGGRKSFNETSVLVVPPTQLVKQELIVQREDTTNPPFQGEKYQTYYSLEYDALTLTGDGDFDLVEDVDAIPSFDFIGNIYESGTYTFKDYLDLGGAFAIELERILTIRCFLPSVLIDSLVANIDVWEDFDGYDVSDPTAKLEVSETNDDPASESATWGVWKTINVGNFSGRGFKFRTTLTRPEDNPDESILVDQLGYKGSMVDRTERSVGAVASESSAETTITFDKPFFTGTTALSGSTTAYLPSVGVNINNMSSGDYVEMGTVTGSDFKFTIKNSSGNIVSRNFTWLASGWGRGV